MEHLTLEVYGMWEVNVINDCHIIIGKIYTVKDADGETQTKVMKYKKNPAKINSFPFLAVL